MKTFKATLYKTGINAAVDVPHEITDDMQPDKGYIRIKGIINGFRFEQTLVPVKGAPYRLFVNIPMLKGGKTAIGDVAEFRIAQDFTPKEQYYEMNAQLQERLEDENLAGAFDALTPSRKKDIMKYLFYIKTEATLQKNIEKVITQLQDKSTDVRVP